MVPLLSIGVAPLSLESLVRLVADRGPATGTDGAVATFLGLVRNHNAGRQVQYLEYEAFEPLALRAFERISEEISGHWPGVRLALHALVEIKLGLGQFARQDAYIAEVKIGRAVALV